MLDYSKFINITPDQLDDVAELSADGDYTIEEVNELVRLRNFMNSGDFWQLPYVDQYADVLYLDDILYLKEVYKVWYKIEPHGIKKGENIDDIFYEEWENNDWFGAIIEDYDYVVSEHMSPEIAKKVYDAAKAQLKVYLTDGTLPEEETNKEEGFGDFFVYCPFFKRLIHLYEGTEDNLLYEDLEQGFNDYINWDSYDSVKSNMALKAIEQIENDELDNNDGGAWLFNNKETETPMWYLDVSNKPVKMTRENIIRNIIQSEVFCVPTSEMTVRWIEVRR